MVCVVCKYYFAVHPSRQQHYYLAVQSIPGLWFIDHLQIWKGQFTNIEWCMEIIMSIFINQYIRTHLPTNIYPCSQTPPSHALFEPHGKCGGSGEFYNMKDVIGRENLIAHGCNYPHGVIFRCICTLTALGACAGGNWCYTILASLIKQVLNRLNMFHELIVLKLNCTPF